jgi:hypothetical protein
VRCALTTWWPLWAVALLVEAASAVKPAASARTTCTTNSTTPIARRDAASTSLQRSLLASLFDSVQPFVEIGFGVQVIEGALAEVCPR